MLSQLLLPLLVATGDSPVEAPPPALQTLYFGDVDADGRDDVVALDPAGRPRLLHNAGDGRFEDVTARAGLASLSGIHQVVFGDANGDRRTDLFLAAWQGSSHLFVQDELGTFADVTDAAGLPAHAEPIDARLEDVDGDGFLDLWLTTLVDDLVYRNDGSGHFEKLELGLEPRPDRVERPATVEEARALRGIGPGTPGTGSAFGPGPSAAPLCTIGIQDQANPAACLGASSVPTLGMLYPISVDWYVDSGSGHTGLGTTSPTYKLDVVGDIRTSGALRANAVPGMPPLIIQSNTRVDHLNADLLDGLSSSSFAQLPIGSGDLGPDSVNGSHIVNGSITGVDLGASSVSSAHIQDGTVDWNDLAPESVSSNHVMDATLGDPDISPVAAIQGTKIVPNFGAQDVLTLGTVDADFGTATEPSFLFDPSEATGISSPYYQAIAFLTDGIERMAVYGSGQVKVGPGLTWGETQLHARIDNGVGTSVAFRGDNESTAGFPIGVYGFVDHTTGVAVNGWASNATGDGIGVRGDTTSWSGRGVVGRNFGGGVAIHGESTDVAGAGVGVFATGNDFGVNAVVPEEFGVGVRGSATYDGLFWADGVHGLTQAEDGYGVFAVNHVAGGTALHASGNTSATGTKGFVQPHPGEAGKAVRFVCLEGNEAGTYFRGASRTLDGLALIAVPEEFRHVTEAEGITVQLTRRGPGDLWVESVDLETIVVRGDTDVEFDYLVNGVRRGYADLEVVVEGRAFQPLERGVPYGSFLPPELRQLLVDNGTLNADFTPNEATAARLGWTLEDPEAAPSELEDPPEPGVPAAEPRARR